MARESVGASGISEHPPAAASATSEHPRAAASATSEHPPAGASGSSGHSPAGASGSSGHSPAGASGIVPRAAGTPPASTIAGRYRLERLLGRGGNGEVWEAHDTLTDDRVAVKLLGDGLGAQAARVRREVAALRLLRLPGVVRLLDEGVDAGGAFLVMERVEGLPFPGLAAPCSWNAMAGAAVGLLETLARMHAAGVVHRDLKPGNVLVRADGQPMLLDFGISYVDSPSDLGLTREGEMLGTMAYIAPEQLVGDPVTPRTDLYAFGVMLYEALAGRLPHEARSWTAMMRARLTGRPVPLRELAPDLPGGVAEVVDQLLSVEASARPGSAVEVLRMLRGQPALAAMALPWLGPDAPVRALRDAVAEGRSADVVGPRGSGRTRCLREVADVAARAGRRVVWATPGKLAFSSLEPLVGSLQEHTSSRLAEVSLAVERRVRDALAGGALLLVDDMARIDDASARAIARCRGAGGVVCAREGAGGPAPPGSSAARDLVEVHLSPLDEVALQGLFAGPDRLLHLREDAARELWKRTGGVPARVADEVTAWVRAGLARWDERRLVVERDAVDRLDTGLRVAPPSIPPDDGAAPLAPHLGELLGWIRMAAPHGDVALLAAATQQPPWRVEACVEELVARGAARVRADGTLEPSAAHAEEGWPWERRHAAHRALAGALRPGAPGRLLHLLAGGDEADAAHAAAIAREASALARRLSHEGHLGKAVVALSEGLRAVRRDELACAAEVVALLSQWTEIALAEATPRALDRVLYEICRTEPRTEAIAHLEELVRAAAAVRVWTERALSMAEAVAPFADPALERARLGIRVAAARRSSLEQEESVLSDIVQRAEGASDPELHASIAGWHGRLRYRQGRYEEAAALQAEAAARTGWVTTRIAAQLNGASALLEALRVEEAAGLIERALGLARRYRHTLYEARAEWLLRVSAYRAGAAGRPDTELLEAFSRAGLSEMEGFVCLNEAAVAWRAGDRGAARDLAERARGILAPLGEPWAALLASGLALACGGDLGEAEVASLLARARRCPLPRVRAQALALISLSGRAAELAPGEVREAALGAGVPRSAWPCRLEVLSIEEVLAAPPGSSAEGAACSGGRAAGLASA
ncbi:protein kinase domain-containing protein [Sorangium sp. So ce1097]|uniref:protein kinase domain-containing protein n=1 Tax=Sorangium sp. So ce1097 TaxID=3133330 RepID=UPI003F640076